jgi:hypothetical protein
MRLSRQQPNLEPTVHPWGEPKKVSLWRRIFCRSKIEYPPNPYEPKREDAFGRNALAYHSYQVPMSVSYDKYLTPNTSSEDFNSSYSPKSPISASSLASTRPSMRSRSSTAYSFSDRYSYAYPEEEQLVLTLTSKYPTGIAADLYEPEVTVVPDSPSVVRSLSAKSYQAKHALIRSYQYRSTSRTRKRQTIHF